MFYMQLLNESVNLMKGHFLYIIFSSSVQQPENKAMKIKGPDTPDSSSDAHDIQHVDLTWIIVIKIRSRCYCGTGYRCIYLFRINQKYVELYTQKGNANTAWYCVTVFTHTTWPCICPFYIPWVIRKSLKWTEWPISSKYLMIHNPPLISSSFKESIGCCIWSQHQIHLTRSAQLLLAMSEIWETENREWNRKHPHGTGGVTSRPYPFPLKIPPFVIPHSHLHSLLTSLCCIGRVQGTQYGVHNKDGPEQGRWAQMFPCSCSRTTATCKNKHFFINENHPPSSYLLIIIINILFFSSATEYSSLLWNFMVVITVIKKSKQQQKQSNWKSPETEQGRQ